MQRNHDDGSEVIIVIATHPRLPPITFSYSLKAAGAAFADAYATRRSLPQNSATLQGAIMLTVLLTLAVLSILASLLFWAACRVGARGDNEQ